LQLQFCKGIPDTIPEFTDGRVTVIAWPETCLLQWPWS
jgi:hypothetical protein